MQAYAELEADTPGTVFGVTQKSDGKWGQKSSANSEKTQGAEHGSSAHDSNADTDEEIRADNENSQRIWRVVGIAIVAMIAFYLSQNQQNHSDTWITNEFVHERGLKSDAENRARFKDA